jgi:hypothetical protein
MADPVPPALPAKALPSTRPRAPLAPVAPGPVASPAGGDRPGGRASPELREAARAFEAAFLAEMLKHTGIGETPEGFGGGAGEAQFSSLLVAAQAREMAEKGGIGLSEHILRAMLAAGGDDAAR